MISDEDLYYLPEDPKEAFVYIESLARQRLDDKLAEARGGYEITELQRHYMNHVIGAAKNYEVESLQNWRVPIDEDEIYRVYTAFRSTAVRITFQFRLERASRNKMFSVAFDAATKEKLRHLLGEIRRTVDKLDVSEAKRDRLYKRIEALALEIDSNRTRMEALGALVAEAAGSAKPLVELVERVAGIIGKAKEEEDRKAKLPAPAERKRIEAPKNRVDPPGGEDEHPF